MNTRIYFTKIRDVKIPQRANQHDAGIDFFIPYFTDEFLEDLTEKNPQLDIHIYQNQIAIPTNQRILIPSGIRVWIEDKNSALIANNKSGIATKKGLIFGASVVDADYTGEIHLSLINVSPHTQYIQEGEKIIQFIHTPIILSSLQEVSLQDYATLALHSDRGEGGFGSTNNQ